MHRASFHINAKQIRRKGKKWEDSAWKGGFVLHSWKEQTLHKKFEQKISFENSHNKLGKFSKLAVHQIWEFWADFKYSPCIYWSLLKIGNLTANIGQPGNVMWKGSGFQYKIILHTTFSQQFLTTMPTIFPTISNSSFYSYSEKIKQKFIRNSKLIKKRKEKQSTSWELKYWNQSTSLICVKYMYIVASPRKQHFSQSPRFTKFMAKHPIPANKRK